MVKVLVVDDDLAGRTLLEALFRAHGYETDTAADGLEALEKARADSCDVVVTDILMPRMDGYQLCREWKSDPALREAPVVFYTGTYTAVEDRRFADDVGADLFISKPADPGLVFESVDGLLKAQLEEGVTTREPLVTEENDMLREHNERLVAKLQHKVAELEVANEGLARALGALDDEVRAKTGLIERLSSDIERRKLAEEELQRTNELLRAVVDGSPLGVVATDRDGIVRVWNPRAEHMFGKSEIDMVGSPYPLVDGEGMTELLETARRGGIGTAVERIAAEDGVPVDAEVFTAPLRDAAGEFDGIVALIADATERAQLDRLKQEFVQMVGHELRTPLTTIIGYGDLLAAMRSRGQLEPDKLAELIERIQAQGAVLAQLVDDLVSVLQLQAEGLRLDLACVDVAALVRSRAEAQRLTKRHRLAFDLPDEPVLFICDADQLGLAVKNVIANAVKFSPDGGDVSVSVDRDDAGIRISVTDQGVGIQADEMSRIFDLFTQLDMSTTRRFGGTGMGLYLTRRIIEAHNGQLEVQSVPGKGSTFTLFLPATSDVRSAGEPLRA